MTNSRTRVGRALRIGLIGSGAATVLAVVFLPLLVVGVLGFIATFLVVACIHGRASGRWGAVWLVSIAGALWVASTVAYGVLWGQAFDLADANQPVPAALHIGTLVLFGTGVLGFVALVAVGIATAVRARRLNA